MARNFANVHRSRCGTRAEYLCDIVEYRLFQAWHCELLGNQADLDMRRDRLSIAPLYPVQNVVEPVDEAEHSNH